MYQKMKVPKITKGKKARKTTCVDLRKEAAIQQAMERKRKDKKAARVLRNQPRWSATDLFKFQTACEIYAPQMRAFESGKIVKTSGKGKDKKVTVTIAPNHPAQPSFNKIYKAVLAGKVAV